MTSEYLWDQIKEELNRLIMDEEYKLFRGSLENLVNATNFALARHLAASGEEAREALDLIKDMQRQVKSGVNPREVFEKVLSESSQRQEKSKAGVGGDELRAADDIYSAQGDINRAERDVIKAGGDVYLFNIPWLLNESYKEIKRGSDQIRVQVVLLVMTDMEAQQLNSEELFEQFKNPVYSQQFGSIQQQLTAAQIDCSLRNYGPTPEDWKPFLAGTETISELVTNALREVRGFNKPLAPDFRDIRMLAPESDERKARASLRLLREEGCMVIMDVISMHHPVIQRAYRRSLLDVYRNIPVLRVAPTDTVHGLDEQDMLAFSDRYRDMEIYKRLNWDPDDSCRESSKGPGLLRWIIGNVPELLRKRGYDKNALANVQSSYKEPDRAA